MKRYSLFCCCLLLTFGIQAQDSVWNGETVINWNKGTSLNIGADKFGTAEVADRMELTLKPNDFVAWAQVALRDGNWTEIPGASSIALGNDVNLYSTDTLTVSFTFTKDFLSTIQQNGVIVTGADFTLYDVSIVKGPGSSGYENAIWIGETDATTGWVALQLPASSFKKTKVGETLRLYYTDLQPGAMHTIVNGSWGAISGYDYYAMSGDYYQYTIDETLLSVMQSGGIIINGTGYKLTHVDVVDPSTLITLTASVPVTNGWLFEGTNPSITVNVTNPYDHEVEAMVKLTIRTDKMESYKAVSKTKTVNAGASVGITLDFEAGPGFYNITPTLNGDAVYTSQPFSNGKKSASFNIGVSPERIISEPDMRIDFEQFWNDTKAELTMIEPRYKLTELAQKSTDKRKVYLLEFYSLKDMGDTSAVARGYYAEPTGEGTFPCIIYYQGYDAGGDVWCPNGNDSPMYAELVLSTRGQLINNRPPYTNNYGDWFVYGFDSKDNYYYRGAFMDAVRAVDFVAGREKVDSNNIFAEGASQGGALTIAAAALANTRVNAIAPAIPFLGDFPDYFELASWPSYPANQARQQLGMSEEQMYTILSYFDTKNLATMIDCPVYQCIGLQDDVCPPHTNMAPYNNLPASVEKKIVYNALMKHATAGTWWNSFHQFFKEHIIAPGNIEHITNDASKGNRRYDLMGRLVDENYKGALISDGHLFLRR